MKPAIIVLIGILSSTAAYTQNFSGQVFIQGAIQINDKCSPVVECDCCTSDLVFISESEVVVIDRCLHNDVYFRGTYKRNGSVLSISFAQFIVKEVYDENTEKLTMIREKLKIQPITYAVSTCDNIPVVLQRTDLKELTKAVRLPAEKERKIREQIQANEAFKMLR